MRRAWLFLVGVLWVASAVWSLPEAAKLRTQSAPPPADTAPYRDLIATYCVTCHNERLKTAGLARSLG